MDKYTELEYRGLNIIDEISTVELAIDWENQRIHVFDTNQVVEPEYHFLTKSYQLSEGFYKMVKVLNDKQIWAIQKVEGVQKGYTDYAWYFYGSRNCILKYENSTMMEVIKIENLNDEMVTYHHLYTKYISKLR
ncbi:aminopeptidase [Ureibacillus sp. Re31]|uniref:Aminopeptidase n=1 Tax=Ureibacillus galli TaxID=2762222 RepID=A0ABR8XC60_9BACL|nr:aminopeptidase [Ureibacillus galli]MBD8026796.1 aminopeptidase [Ureibacillus galli]